MDPPAHPWRTNLAGRSGPFVCRLVSARRPIWPIRINGGVLLDGASRAASLPPLMPARLRRPRPESGVREREYRSFRAPISEGIMCVEPHENKKPATRAPVRTISPLFAQPAHLALSGPPPGRPLKSVTGTARQDFHPGQGDGDACIRERFGMGRRASQAATQCTSLLSAPSRGIMGDVFFVDTMLTAP